MGGTPRTTILFMGTFFIRSVAAMGARTGTLSSLRVAGTATRFQPLSVEKIRLWRPKLEEAARRLREIESPVTQTTLAAQLQVKRRMVERRLAALFQLGEWPQGVPKRLRGQRPPKSGQELSDVERQKLIQEAVKELRDRESPLTQLVLAVELGVSQPRLSEWLHHLEAVGLYPDNFPQLKWSPRTPISLPDLSPEEICFGFHWAALDLLELGRKLTQKSLAEYLGMSEIYVRRGFALLAEHSLWVRHGDISQWVSSLEEERVSQQTSVSPTPPSSAPTPLTKPTPQILRDQMTSKGPASGETQRERDTDRLLKALQKYGEDRMHAAQEAGLSLSRARFLIWRAPKDSPIAAYKDPADDLFFAQYED